MKYKVTRRFQRTINGKTITFDIAQDLLEHHWVIIYRGQPRTNRYGTLLRFINEENAVKSLLSTDLASNSFARHNPDWLRRANDRHKKEFIEIEIK